MRGNEALNCESERREQTSDTSNRPEADMWDLMGHDDARHAAQIRGTVYGVYC